MSFPPSALPLYTELEQYIESLFPAMEQLPDHRKSSLKKLADYIQSSREKRPRVSLNFICTHNSRRSHISQIWAATAAAYYGVDHLKTYSGGTEATAFNPRAVAAMERAGFHIENPEGINPAYQVSFSAKHPALVCFSKVFDDPVNPSSNFAAIMTCSDADENCPFIPGTEFRLALTYQDPKIADDSPEETARYDERVRQIGTEMFYAFHLLATPKL